MRLDEADHAALEEQGRPASGSSWDMARALEVAEVNDIWADLAVLGLVMHPFDLIRDGRAAAAEPGRGRAARKIRDRPREFGLHAV